MKRSLDVTTMSGRMLQPPLSSSFGAGGISSGSPSGAPASAQAASVAICPGLRRMSSLYCGAE